MLLKYVYAKTERLLKNVFWVYADTEISKGDVFVDIDRLHKETHIVREREREIKGEEKG